MKRVCLLITGLLLSANALADSCDSATSQAGLNECASNEYKKQDDSLNQTYKEAMKLATDTQKTQLKAAQNAWIAFRDADCAFLTSGADGASVAPMVHAQCMTDKTRERTELLKSTLQCEEGDVSCVFHPQQN
ncbi:lysozyme inhibitor LprI family protein [Buttiauxella sp. A2-C1_F]|uniref:lysozyme inhibitor LprI family protein n=1 Tax=Buttiauxella sp. A2-C1_F TaxID=2904526 RepID=UPI001E628862|nr:lysozyme inhibitor LprI family protein [Buttiauxella sp. A2-C1_F]MCE0847986.1 lysozyme inhibitor LprI family protein [Buttiauxella sp. A2-C1_F]